MNFYPKQYQFSLIPMITLDVFNRLAQNLPVSENSVHTDDQQKIFLHDVPEIGVTCTRANIGLRADHPIAQLVMPGTASKPNFQV